MKKVFVVVAVLVALAGCKAAEAWELKAHGKVSGQMAYAFKMNEPAGVDIRNVNPGFNFDADIGILGGLYFGTNVNFIPGAFSIPVLGIEGDIDMVGVTFGPLYYVNLADAWEAYAGVGFGYYNTEVSALGLSTDKDSFGMQGSMGINYKWKHLTAGLKTQVHYIADAGAKDDAMVWTVGPTIGVVW